MGQPRRAIALARRGRSLVSARTLSEMAAVAALASDPMEALRAIADAQGRALADDQAVAFARDLLVDVGLVRKSDPSADAPLAGRTSLRLFAGGGSHGRGSAPCGSMRIRPRAPRTAY